MKRCLFMILLATFSLSAQPSDPPHQLLDAHTASVLWVAFTPDGKTLASSSRDHSVMIWDVATGTQIRKLEEHTEDVYCGTYSHDGSLLATCSGDKTICLWDAHSYELKKTLTGHTGIVRNVDFSPDGKTLVSGSTDLTVRLWDVASGTLKKTLPGHTGRVKSTLFSSDSKFIASAGTDKNVRLWDAKTGDLLRILESPERQYEAIAISPDSKLVAGSSSAGPIIIWDAATGKLLQTLTGHTLEGDSLAFRPDGKVLATGNKDKTITLWDTQTWKSILVMKDNKGRIESVAFSPDGRTLANGGGGGDTLVKLWDLGELMPGKTVALKTESFDRDPKWDGFNNHLTPKKIPTVTQDFGYSESNFAGKERGEMGGQVWRTTTPAFYAAKIPTRTLNDKLSASGTFAITETSGAAGLFFGWFDSTQPPSGGRPRGSLGLDINCERAGGQLAVRLISGSNKSCGTFITPFTPGPTHGWYTPLKKNMRFTWKLTYDPAGGGGNGQFQFTMKSHLDTHEDWEGKTFSVDVPAENRKDGATFDHFGLVNGGKSGNPMKIYFDDLEFDGKKEDFLHDPGWDDSGNHVTFQDPDPSGAHHFGFSADTHFAGGKAGEIGGTFWRTDKNYGYYGDRVGPLTLKDRLEASGKVILQIGAPDSAMYIGWFNSAATNEPPHSAGNFLGVAVTGPTRIGHYFLPVCVNAKGEKQKIDKGPIITPGKIYDWKIVYDPTENDGKGSIKVNLGDESVTLNLKGAAKNRNATFDRFGLSSAYPGGGLVKIYFDDLSYTKASSPR